MVFPQQWSSPCGNECTHKYSALMQIPFNIGNRRSVCGDPMLLVCHSYGRVFCKKGCDADGDTWEDCVGECNEICYKDPVLKDHQWSAYIDRSPGAENYSTECFHACVSGCAFRFSVSSTTVSQVHQTGHPNPVQRVSRSNHWLIHQVLPRIFHVHLLEEYHTHLSISA